MVCSKTRDLETKQHCVKLLEDLGSLEYTRNFLKFLYEDLKKVIESFGGNPALERELEHVIEKLGI